jgi:putative endonuclease
LNIGAKTTKTRGDEAEDRALAYLRARGLCLVQRHYRVARGPGAPGGEIDLILRDGTTLVFVEVRSRRASAARFGGAAASIGAAKRQRLVKTALHYLMRWPAPPACRFDVVAIDGERIEWLPGAFDAG